MKTKVLSLVVMFVLGTFTVFAGEKTEKFKVKGNCGMCETRIEKAAKSVKGVSAAEWDSKTTFLTVVYDDEVTNVNKVHVAVAGAGHDTEQQKAKDEVYNKLPSCCKYERK